MAATQHPYVEKLTWDREANAAYLYIRPDGPGKFARTLPVDDKDGTTVATLYFAAHRADTLITLTAHGFLRDDTGNRSVSRYLFPGMFPENRRIRERAHYAEPRSGSVRRPNR